MEHVEKLRRRSALRRDAPIYRPDEFPSAALRRPAGAAPALGVSGGQYDDYGRRVADRDNGRTAYDGHGQSRKPLHPAGQIPFRSACQPLGDASGVRHGRRPVSHSRAARDGTPKRLRSTSSSPNRTTPITRGSTISRRTTNRNAVSMWKSSSTTPPITT